MDPADMANLDIDTDIDSEMDARETRKEVIKGDRRPSRHGMEIFAECDLGNCELGSSKLQTN